MERPLTQKHPRHSLGGGACITAVLMLIMVFLVGPDAVLFEVRFLAFEIPLYIDAGFLFVP